MRDNTAYRLGKELVVNRGPDNALNMPKAVSGATMDFRSLSVKSQRVLKWKKSELLVLVACRKAISPVDLPAFRTNVVYYVQVLLLFQPFENLLNCCVLHRVSQV